MEVKKLPNYNNNESIKNLIASIIDKQIGKNLKTLEQKNDSSLKEINQIARLSKELINTLDSFYSKIRKKIIEQKNQKKKINKTNLRTFSPMNSSLKHGKTKKFIINNDFNNIHRNISNIDLKNNLMKQKSLTPLKTLNTIMKKNNNLKYKKQFKSPSKSIDISRKNRNIVNLDIQKKNSHIYNKRKIKTPTRKKNKIYLNKICKTEDKSSKKIDKIDFDLTSLDNDIEITKISINYDENQNQELVERELNNINKTRLTIKLGAFAEKIENEKLLVDDDIFFSKSFDNFYKIIEIIFENLFSFLDIKSFFNFMMINKTYSNLIIKLLVIKIEKKIKNINQYLTDLKSNNKAFNLKEEKIKSFEYNNSSIRALSILNSLTVEKFFSEKKINFEDKNIKIIFDLYFIALGKKKDIVTCNFENGFREKYVINYFKNGNKKTIGNILDNELKQIQFNEKIVNSIYEYSYNKINIISPKNFQRINKNITWFCYLIKNILEHLGIINKDNKNIKQIYNIYCSRLHINKELLNKLKKLQNFY